MILTCPQCETRYQTDAALFGANGRKVRCAKCGHVWLQAPPTVQPESESESVPSTEPAPPAVEPARHQAFAPTAVSEASAPASPTRVNLGVTPERLVAATGWAGLAALLVLVVWTAMHFRQEIATVWPQSASFYAAVGRPVNTRGIRIEVLNYQNAIENGQAVLSVTGRLTNITAHELPVPPIRITLTDKDRRVLYDWSFSARVATLHPGQAVSFATRLTNPPNASQLHAQFADNSE